MKPIVFCHGQSKLSYASASVMLRFAYLFAKCAISMGDAETGMGYEIWVDKLTLKQKLAYLESAVSKQDDGEMLETISGASGVIKAYNSIKHKTPQQMIVFRKFEQNLHELFISEVKPIKDHLIASGLTVFPQLHDGKSLAYFRVNAGNAETRQQEYEVTASEVLTDGYTAEEAFGTPEFGCVFFLSPHFFDEEFSKQYKLVSAYSKEAENPCNVYLEEIFALPNVNSLKAEELKKIKTQLGAFAEEFLGESEQFSEQCYKNDGPAKRINLFTEKVLPLAKAYRQHIEQNEMLQLCQRIHLNTLPATVMMGEIPIVLLWQFYRYMNLIKDETWSVLEPLMEHEKFINKRWPVVAIKKPSFLDGSFYSEEMPKPQTVQVRKKFIPVD